MKYLKFFLMVIILGLFVGQSSMGMLKNSFLKIFIARNKIWSKFSSLREDYPLFFLHST